MRYLIIFSVLVFCFVSCVREDTPTPLPEVLFTGDSIIESYDSTLTLKAEPLKKGLEGYWSVVSEDSSFFFSDSLDPQAVFHGNYGLNYKLYWTVSNGKESKSDSLFLAIYRPLPAILISGEKDIEVYSDHLMLIADPLSSGLLGEWTVSEGPANYTLDNSKDPTSAFTGELTCAYTLNWKVSNGKDHASEIVKINFVGITDSRDGEKYKVVKIGEQIWMAENLRTVKYQNGDSIPDGTGLGDCSMEAEPAYVFSYNDDPANSRIYGRLYTWYVVSDPRDLCPTGWHISSNTEWGEMMNYLDGDVVAGGKLKESGTSHWITPNQDASNSSGFTALPGGYFNYNGLFYYLGNYGRWWSSRESSSTHASGWGLAYDNGYISASNYLKKLGFSVRCVKD